MLDKVGPYLEEPPDTPAPLFAVRAFKSALFGTPHPDLKYNTNSPLASNGQSQQQEIVARAENTKPVRPITAVTEGSVVNVKADSLVSPMKGILVTPGTATARRKNVSFGGLAFNEAKETKTSNDTDLKSSVHSGGQLNPSTMDFPPVDQHRQTNLTKALYKARIDGPRMQLEKSSSKPKPGKDDVALQEGNDDLKSQHITQEPVYDPAIDITIDLNEPASRSGQHWKAEFERYHKRSDREMKKIIKYGQSFKSYAVKKDSETADIGEKLQRELSKIATMEANVTSLAAQLANTRRDNPKETSEQARLVNDLAKQTALAVRYKQKADKYKLALMEQSNATKILESSTIGDTPIPNSNKISLQAAINPYESHEINPELGSLRAELENFRNSSQRAERKATQLETENLALKRDIARLKEEIEMIETRRKAKEERSRMKIEKLEASQKERDLRSMELTSEYPKLVPKAEQQEPLPGTVAEENLHYQEKQRFFDKQDVYPAAEIRKPFDKRADPQSLKIKTKQRQRQSNVEIWTSPGMDSTLPLEKSMDNTLEDLVNGSTFPILKDIHQNLVPEIDTRGLPSTESSPISPLKPLNLLSDDLGIPSPPHPSISFPLPSTNPTPQKPHSSATNRMRDRKSIIPSPRPSMINFPSKLLKSLHPPTDSQDPIAPSFNLIPNSRMGNSAHDKSAGFVPFTARTGIRGAASRLSDDRFAAAKARLQKKKEEKRLGDRGRYGRGKVN